jgi:prepilin-type N-terminal cleavage/methylation domain-containing protein
VRPSRSSTSQGSQGGFALIEILIVVAIIGVTLGAVMVQLGGLTAPERIRAAARKLAGMSDFVRSQAAGSRVACYLDIDFDLSRFRWRIDPPLDELGQPVDVETRRPLTVDEVEEWRESFEWEDLPRGVYFDKLFFNNKMFYDKDKQWIEYRPDGTVSSYVLWIKAKEDDQEDLRFSIRVNGLTGKSEVAKGHVTMKDATESDFTQVMGEGGGGGAR